jgi:hypothetical protein
MESKVEIVYPPKLPLFYLKASISFTRFITSDSGSRKLRFGILKKDEVGGDLKSSRISAP